MTAETAHNVVLLSSGKSGDLSFVYFGKKLSDTSEYQKVIEAYKDPLDYTGQLASAYTPSGSRNLAEPAISVTHSDGNNSLDLKYISHRLAKMNDDISLLSIKLMDPVYPFEVTLYYKIYYQEDAIEQWCVIRHQEKGDVTLNKFASANLYLKADSYWLRQYHGDWVKEMQPEESELTHGIKTIDSKLGTRTNLFEPSVFMVSLNKPATEDEGSVLYGS